MALWPRLLALSWLLAAVSGGGDYCVGTANESIDASRPNLWIQIAGTLNCGSGCRGSGRSVDEETLDFYAAYQMWTDHVNGLGGVRVGSAAPQRFFVNITLCDDQGDASAVDRLYRQFACGDMPQADFLLSPYGSSLVRHAHEAVSRARHSDGTGCYKPVMLAGGATADDVLGLRNLFSPLVPASKLAEPVLETLRDAARRYMAARTLSTYAVLSSRGPFESWIATSLRRLLPVSCYDDSVVYADDHGRIKGCETGSENKDYCHPTKFVLENNLVNGTGLWTPRPPTRVGDDSAGEGGCGTWDMGYCGGPKCNGSIPMSPYAAGEYGTRGHGQVQGIVYNNTYAQQQGSITGAIYQDLSNIWQYCDNAISKGGSCELDALIAAGHSREFEQFVRVLGTFADEHKVAHLPKFAVFIGGLRPTARMVSHKENYPYVGWLGSTSWHEAMGRHSSASAEFLGNSSYFKRKLQATFRNYDVFGNNTSITAYHAQAAATLVMLQLALLELPTPTTPDRGKVKMMFVEKNCSTMNDAFASVDSSTFFGPMKINPSGWNERPGISAGVLQILGYGQEPVLVGPPSLKSLGATPEKLIYNAFCTGRCSGGVAPHHTNPATCPGSLTSNAEEIIKLESWNRSPRCYSSPQIAVCASLFLVLVACIVNCTRYCGRKDPGLQRNGSAGLRESLLGTGGASDYLPNASVLAAVWSPRGERSSFELHGMGSLGSEGADLSSVGSFSSVTSEEEVRPSHMFRDRDSRGLTGLKQIGKGSFGVVSQAIWKRGGEDGKNLHVAVKELELKATAETPMAKEMMRDLLKEFRKEVEICVALDHPNLVKFYGYTQHDPKEKSKKKGRVLRLRIIQELMRGGALDHLLYTEKWEPGLAQTLKMSKDVADAMVYLHAIGDATREPIIHRDLKSPNLLLVEYPPTNDVPVVKITDFGLARQKDVRDNEETESFRASFVDAEAREQARRTQMMTGCGTLYWMSPEVLKGEVYNESVDVYAFAMCVWEMVAHEVPWQSVAAAEVPYKVVMEAERPASRGETECGLKNLITDCWSQNPHDRPSFDQIRDRIADMQAALGSGA